MITLHGSQPIQKYKYN